MLKSVRNIIQSTLRPKGLRSFISSLNKNYVRLLDVGCGNESSIFIKNINPAIDVHGIDICDYNQSVLSKRL